MLPLCAMMKMNEVILRLPLRYKITKWKFKSNIEEELRLHFMSLNLNLQQIAFLNKHQPYVKHFNDALPTHQIEN